MKQLLVISLFWLTVSTVWSQAAKVPVHLAMYGLAHDHAGGFIPRARGRPEVRLVGIVETNQDLIARYAKRFGLETNLFYDTLEGLLAKTKVEAVATFTSTFEHPRVVEACARRGLQVMVEKPLAVSLEQARAIAAAARKARIQVVVNYETTWYPANQQAYAMIHGQGAIGEIRKVVVHDGHRGPKEIGCSDEFLAWLTDPVLNGGGALTDFGCYGADLVTWLMEGELPTSVLALAQQIKPEVYPKVDDEATILLSYPHSQAVIQASWNWPFDRKDMEVYGRTGYVLVPRRDVLKIRKAGGQESEIHLDAPITPGPFADEVAYFAAVVRGEIQPSGLSSLEVNLVVSEILDAARESARTGKRIDLPRR